MRCLASLCSGCLLRETDWMPTVAGICYTARTDACFSIKTLSSILFCTYRNSPRLHRHDMPGLICVDAVIRLPRTYHLSLLRTQHERSIHRAHSTTTPIRLRKSGVDQVASQNSPPRSSHASLWNTLQSRQFNWSPAGKQAASVIHPIQNKNRSPQKKVLRAKLNYTVLAYVFCSS
jgi:hypothetical protein